jgi:hypothetical protein
MVILAIVVLALGVLALAALTATGEHHRGAGLPLALVAGLCFPVTWTVWYIRDEHPYARS